MANSRSRNKKVVSVPLPLALLAAIEKYAAEKRIDRVAAITLFCRERLNLPEHEDAKFLMRHQAEEWKRNGNGSGTP